MIHIIFVLYDGVKNSVFHSQVLTPLLNDLEENKDHHVTLLSFERHMPTQKQLRSLIPSHDRLNLNLVIRKRLPFLYKPSLWPAALSFARLVKTLNPTRVVARGALAGWIAMKGLRGLGGVSLVVQARGLAAEEFRYSCARQRCTFTKGGAFFSLRYRWLKVIEEEVYAKTTIQAISPALRDYLITTFHADPERVTVATHDIPKPLPKETVAQWRTQVRQDLVIPPNAHVYCYLGSARPWQCVDEMIEYFVKKYEQNKNSFFLVLTTDVVAFEEKLREKNVNDDCYRVLSIHPDETFRYLSAADAGLLFRESDIVNWVSRPTKLLEYQAVGLRVIDNGTVGWLVSTEPSSPS